MDENSKLRSGLKHSMTSKLREPHFFSLLFVSLVMGCFVGLLVWFFFLCFKFGRNFIWPDTVPFGLSLPVYRACVFAVGGVITGTLQKYWGGYPKGLSAVVEINRKHGSFGFDNIPAVFLTAMVPLIFGSAIGPEASLMSFISTVICYIGNRWNMDREKLQIFTFVGISAGLGACFKRRCSDLWSSSSSPSVCGKTTRSSFRIRDGLSSTSRRYSDRSLR